jgi:hypothetical protein
MMFRSDLAAAEQHQAFAGFVIGNQLLQGLRSIATIHGLDADDFLVLGTIAAANLQRAVTRRRPNGAVNVGPITFADLVPISRSAVSRATELPRETVRRKAIRLVERGWLCEVKGGLIAVPSAEAEARNHLLLAEVLAQFSLAANLLLSIGALRAVENFAGQTVTNWDPPGNMGFAQPVTESRLASPP